MRSLAFTHGQPNCRAAIRPVLQAAAFTLLICATAASIAQDSLEAGFQNPPDSARPRVWWHWMNGNIAADGARLDLEWMQRIGIGGVHIFSGGKFPAPGLIKPPATFMSPAWQDIFRQSVAQAHDYKMEVGIAGSPGWSQTGGPWVAPADAMKKYVWSEITIEGGRPFQGRVPAPPRVTGPFQTKSQGDLKAEAYGDAAVIAFPTPALERELPKKMQWHSSQGPIDLVAVSTGDLANSGTVKLVPPSGSNEAWIEAASSTTVTIGAVSFGIKEGGWVTLQVESDPGVFRTFAEGFINPSQSPADHPAPQETLAFSPVSGSRFRIVFTAAPARRRRAIDAVLPVAKQTTFTLSQVRMIGGARVNGFEAKAGFEPSIASDAAATPSVPRAAVIDSKAVVNLTQRLRADGTLQWTPSPGRWTIVRLGWSLTGRVNSPAEPSSTGLEVDKLDAQAVRRYLAHYLSLYERASDGKLGSQGIQTLLTDSWEAGVQNWTPAMLTEFRARRGYDATAFLPVLTGRIVDSSETSEHFLYDFRQTLKDLVVDNHYAVIASELHARGMTYYTESQGDSPRAIADGMTVKSRADIPTAEFWYRPWSTLPGQPPLKADVEEAASVGHVYGKPIVAGEALTVAAMNDPWAFAPSQLKPVADEIFARGVNRLLLHESHHQPLVDAKPGLGLFIFGQYFNRNDTWAEYASPWVSYLARTSYLLQQGQFVADVAYFYGEERNLTELFLERFNQDVPKGYAYDYINPDALLNLLSVSDGRIVTPSGMHYRVLFIPDHVRHLSLPTLRKLRKLVADGATLVGTKTLGGLGLASPDAQIRALADELWGTNAEDGRSVGKGRVYTSLSAALSAQQIAPDVALEGQSSDGELLTLHRRTDAADIYFISNQSNESQTLRARFRVDGRAPAIWRAETGTIERASYERGAGTTLVPLTLAAHEAVFVVFQEPATAERWTAPQKMRTELATLEGPWRLAFQPGRGAPPSATFDRLMSWTDSPDSGIRYFSGAATYSTQLKAPRSWLKSGRRIELDLGHVRELAVVTVNGTRLKTAWHAPFRVDITGALKPGQNRIDIEVVNLWPNRLIGDEQPGATPIAFAPMSPYSSSSPLLPSGLLGPVSIVAVEQMQ